jgi:hypothetical protein
MHLKPNTPILPYSNTPFRFARLASEIFLSSLQAELFSNLLVSCLRNLLNKSGVIPGTPAKAGGDPESRNFKTSGCRFRRHAGEETNDLFKRTFVSGH